MFTRSHRLVMIIVYAFEPGAILSNSKVKLEKKNNLFKRKNVIIYMYKYFFSGIYCMHTVFREFNSTAPYIRYTSQRKNWFCSTAGAFLFVTQADVIVVALFSHFFSFIPFIYPYSYVASGSGGAVRTIYIQYSIYIVCYCMAKRFVEQDATVQMANHI